MALQEPLSPALSLRHRFGRAAAFLLAFQVLATLLALLAGLAVHTATRTEEDLAAQREIVLALSDALREQYVHQAHTLIEGGPHHLDHLAPVAAEVEARTAAVAALPLAAGVPLQEEIPLLHQYFEVNVAPRARDGTLTPSLATTLHGALERQGQRVALQVATVRRRIEEAQQTARAEATFATRLAALSTLGCLLGGGVTAWVGSRRLALAVEVSADRRAHADRLAALGEMSAAVAHELMNPLTTLLSDPALSDPALASLRAEAVHARNVVQGLLGFSRPQEEPAARVDVLSLALAAADRALPLADLKDVRIDVTGAPVALEVSPSGARQVLDNLLRNAVEAAPPGSAVRVRVGDDTLWIEEDGPGLPPGVRQRLYAPFVTGKPQGTGLGLAISARIVRAMGGELHHPEGLPSRAGWRYRSEARREP